MYSWFVSEIQDHLPYLSFHMIPYPLHQVPTHKDQHHFLNILNPKVHSQEGFSYHLIIFPQNFHLISPFHNHFIGYLPLLHPFILHPSLHLLPQFIHLLLKHTNPHWYLNPQYFPDLIGFNHPPLNYLKFVTEFKFSISSDSLENVCKFE